jgi:hypothetical protein
MDLKCKVYGISCILFTVLEKYPYVTMYMTLAHPIDVDVTFATIVDKVRARGD